MHHVRRGDGRPLLLLHGLGGHWRSWSPILDALAAERAVIAVDLPGFGETPPLPGEVSIATLADAVTGFLSEHDLLGVDVVGSSMGARLALELARRGVTGATVALAPGGFWRGWHRQYFYSSIAASIRLIRLLQPAMPALTRSGFGRKLLFAQFSPHTWHWSPELALDEMRSYASSHSFDELLQNLAFGPPQEGAARGTLNRPLTIGWGRKDRVCFPEQAERAVKFFPDARLHWFDEAGHFPHWDAPKETVDLVLAATARDGGRLASSIAPPARVRHEPRH